MSMRTICIAACVSGLLAGAAGAAQAPAGTDPADPTKGSKNIDRVVEYPAERVLAAAKLAAATYGCEIKRERDNTLECTRDRHIGLVVGSGGEKVTVKLTPNGAATRVVIETGKGFVGRLGKKNWSTPIFTEIVRLLQES